MSTYSKGSLVFVWIVSLFCMGESFAQGAAGLDNLALSKKYTLSPKPNYRYCTEAGDQTQLTDGAHSQGYFWTQPSTVGWRSDRSISITIDLGAVEPIAGLSYNTAAGKAGVDWPLYILILVSDDGEAYSLAGELVALDAERGGLPEEGYRVHPYWTDQLETRGRYVKLIVNSSGSFIFADEIEVYRGAESLLREPFVGEVIVDVDLFLQGFELTRQVRRRLRDDLAAVRAAAEHAGENVRISNELAAIERDIPELQVPASEDFRTVFPINDLHRRIFAVQAALWRQSLSDSLVVWQTHRWDMVSPTEAPQPRGASVEVVMMQNEFRAAAFNLSNCGWAPAELRLSFENLPGGSTPDYITVHDAPFTDTRSGVPIIAALPAAKRSGESYVLTIEPGMTRQVWLTFHSKDLPAGDYRGRIQISAGELEIPVHLKVYPFMFPDEPTLHLGGWDYTNVDEMYDVTNENRPLLIQHLRERFVDTPWATNAVMPTGKYDAGGNMIEAPDPTRFRTWLDRWPDTRNYYVFSSVKNRFAGFEMGTKPFNQAVSNWITWWVQQLAEWGIEPEQLGLLLVDEPHTLEQDATVVGYARVIREAQPDVVIWEDMTWREPWQANPELFHASDVLSPNLPMWIREGAAFADFYLKQQEAGKELWFYSCSGPGKLLDPYAYHLMQQWFCWRYGAKGSAFWAFGDSNRASSWNEYASSKGAYTPVFLDAISVTAGKHMEAIREGMEDFEYLQILSDRVAELESQGLQGKAITEAKALLDSAAERVTACMVDVGMLNWAEPKDRSIADQIRVEVLESLLKLREL